MAENKMSEIIRTSLEGIHGFSNNQTIIGEAINTPGGVTVIPVSKVSIGLATGGIDYGAKKINNPQSFGGGGGTGISITPLAFLTVSPDAEVKLIPVAPANDNIAKIADLIEHAPEIVEKIKGALS